MYGRVPTGNLGVNLPSVDSIIKKTKEAAISKACSIAREKVSQLTGSISESISIDMPVIGNIANGSVSTGTGSSSGSEQQSTEPMSGAASVIQ
ncbi:Uncharacterised protein [Escherichia coli]|uniref:Uncharacterized protein n=1 Tax=Escherichia coli TaxID=562 RepID=A0A2X3K5H8_ECOLX|nr:Uncharacterised protein [Escherichia coli]